MLPVVPPPEDSLVGVQPVRHGRPVDLHAGGEDDQLVPARDHLQEEVDVRPLVHEEAHRVAVDRHLEDEVWRRAGLDGLSQDAVVVRVDQGLVEVQHKHLAADQTWSTKKRVIGQKVHRETQKSEEWNTH